MEYFKIYTRRYEDYSAWQDFNETNYPSEEDALKVVDDLIYSDSLKDCEISICKIGKDYVERVFIHHLDPEYVDG